METVFNFIDSTLIEGTDRNILEYSIVTHFPKVVVSELDSSLSIEQAIGKDKSLTLFVEKL